MNKANKVFHIISKLNEKELLNIVIPDLAMSENEILSSYNKAEDKHTQLEILAQLNALTITQMAAFLVQHGYHFDGLTYVNEEPKDEKPKVCKQQENKYISVGKSIKVSLGKGHNPNNTITDRPKPNYIPNLNQHYIRGANMSTNKTKSPLEDIITVEEMTKRYVTNNESAKDIAASLNVPVNKVQWYIRSHNISKNTKITPKVKKVVNKKSTVTPVKSTIEIKDASERIIPDGPAQDILDAYDKAVRDAEAALHKIKKAREDFIKSFK